MSKPRKNLLLRFDRALSGSILKQAAILAGILVATLLISLVFLSLSKTQWFDICQNKQISPFLLPIYLLIDQNVFNELYRFVCTFHNKAVAAVHIELCNGCSRNQSEQ